MKKLSLLFGICIISVNCYAAGPVAGLNIALLNTFDNHHSHTTDQGHLAIIYGGHDFSHEQMADANESFWSGQPKALG